MSEGLLSGVLPFIFSQSDRLKRNINGWINDPAAKAEQSAGILYDNLNEQTRLQNQAFGDPKDPLRITDQRAFEAATNGILNGVMGFAPAGMTKLVGPQSQALETARKNAVRMLGLPENNTAMDRAKAMMFGDEVYHGTTKSFPAFDPSKLGASGADAAEGIFTANNPRIANEFTWANGSQEGANVLPLMLRTVDPVKAPLMLDGTTGSAAAKILQQSKRAGYDRVDFPTNMMGAEGTSQVVFDPSRVRSRFAAFDPARVKENDLLAGMMPLGALSGVSTLPPDFLTAKDTKKKDKDKK